MVNIPIIDSEKTKNQIIDFIKNKVNEANVDGIVIGLSGGIDSTVVAYLLCEAIGSKNVFGVIMPSETTPLEDTYHGEEIANLLNIDYNKVDIDPILDQITYLDDDNNKESIGNLKARIRMSILYYFANSKNYLVSGTGNKSEILIGYFTKYGDGACDFEPIAGLYKTQVKQLANDLGIPCEIIEKPPRAGLWDNQTDEDEIGIDYDLLDKILYLLNDKKLPVSQINEKFSNVNEIDSRIENNKHKNRLPESPNI